MQNELKLNLLFLHYKTYISNINMKQIISFAICCLLLSNCGLKRPLTLPEEPKEIKVEMR